MSGRTELAVPAGAGKVRGSGVNNAMTPVNAEHALAAEFLSTLHVRLKAAGSELGKPHGGIIFDPRDGPTFAAAELAKNFIHGIPSEGIIQGRKNYVFRKPLMQGLEM